MDMIVLQWLFPVAITLHNLEEAIWLPAWSKHAGRWHREVRPPVFRFAVSVLTVLAYAVTSWSVSEGPETVATYLLCGYALAMLLNVLFPHVIASIALRRYMPGLGSALLLNLPVTFLLLKQAFAQGYVHMPAFLYYGAGVSLAVALSIPALFALGESVIPEDLPQDSTAE
jgi:hypothetical protein